MTTVTITDPSQDIGTVRFRPSIAAGSFGTSTLSGLSSSLKSACNAALWALQATLTINPGAAAPSSVMTASARWVPVTRASAVLSVQRQATEATSQELISTLKAKGMPVAALSEALNVERKTIYSWLDEGRDAKPENHERLRIMHSLLSSEQDGTLRFFHRFWDRKIPGVGSLKAVLTSPDIDLIAARKALEVLRPAVFRAMDAHAERKAVQEVKSPAASLTLLLHT